MAKRCSYHLSTHPELCTTRPQYLTSGHCMYFQFSSSCLECIAKMSFKPVLFQQVIKHWNFREIRDCNYSGFSFTLTPRSGSDYFVRTDDGEAICTYIEAFQKDPTAALVSPTLLAH